MKIEVTADDIRSGSRGICFDCPVARAIRRTLKLRSKVYIRTIGKRKGINIKDKTYEIIASVREKISNYDLGKVMKPFSFNLPIE